MQVFRFCVGKERGSRVRVEESPRHLFYSIEPIEATLILDFSKLTAR